MKKIVSKKQILDSLAVLEQAFPKKGYYDTALSIITQGVDISILGLSKRTENVLRKHGIHNHIQLTKRTGRELDALIKLEGVWHKSLNEIKVRVHEFLS